MTLCSPPLNPRYFAVVACGGAPGWLGRSLASACCHRRLPLPAGASAACRRPCQCTHANIARCAAFCGCGVLQFTAGLLGTGTWRGMLGSAQRRHGIAAGQRRGQKGVHLGALFAHRARPQARRVLVQTSGGQSRKPERDGGSRSWWWWRQTMTDGRSKSGRGWGRDAGGGREVTWLYTGLGVLPTAAVKGSWFQTCLGSGSVGACYLTKGRSGAHTPGPGRPGS